MTQRPRPSANNLTLTALHPAIWFSGLFATFTAQRWGNHPLADTAEQVAPELIARALATTGNPDPNDESRGMCGMWAPTRNGLPWAASSHQQSLCVRFAGRWRRPSVGTCDQY